MEPTIDLPQRFHHFFCALVSFWCPRCNSACAHSSYDELRRGRWSIKLDGRTHSHLYVSFIRSALARCSQFVRWLMTITSFLLDYSHHLLVLSRLVGTLWSKVEVTYDQFPFLIALPVQAQTLRAAWMYALRSALITLELGSHLYPHPHCPHPTSLCTP